MDNIISCDRFKWLCPKHYRLYNSDSEYPIKVASAGCDKEQVKKIKNKDYNIDLVLNKKATRFGINGKEIVNVPYVFKKWKSKIIKRLSDV